MYVKEWGQLWVLFFTCYPLQLFLCICVCVCGGRPNRTKGVLLANPNNAPISVPHSFGVTGIECPSVYTVLRIKQTQTLMIGQCIFLATSSPYQPHCVCVCVSLYLVF